MVHKIISISPSKVLDSVDADHGSALQSSVGAQAQVEATIYNARLIAWLKGVGFYY